MAPACTEYTEERERTTSSLWSLGEKKPLPETRVDLKSGLGLEYQVMWHIFGCVNGNEPKNKSRQKKKKGDGKGEK